MILCPLGGELSRIDRNSMALNVPDTPWMYFCEANSFSPIEQEHEIAWAREFMTGMRPWSVDQAPPNFLEPDEGAVRLRASYGEDKYRKLVAIKNIYDPSNVFLPQHQHRTPPLTPRGARRPGLGRGPAAVDGEDLPGHVARSVRREEQERTVDFL